MICGGLMSISTINLATIKITVFISGILSVPYSNQIKKQPKSAFYLECAISMSQMGPKKPLNVKITKT